MSFAEALAAERVGDIESASVRYEEALMADCASLDVLLNLVVLYWQSTDVGLAAAKALSPSFLARAGSRIPQLLDEAERRFPASTEVRFWRRYIAWADLGEELDGEDCRQLLREDPATLVPAMHLFALSHGSEAEAEAHELLRSCRGEGTARARYIISVLEGVMKRAGFRKPWASQ